MHSIRLSNHTLSDYFIKELNKTTALATLLAIKMKCSHSSLSKLNSM